MLWLNFLHFYQPANSELYNLQKALDKSYLRLLGWLEDNPRLRLTANISGCLLESLAAGGQTDYLQRFKSLVKQGRLELTGSAAYHGFLPLLPEAEVIRQIKVNEKILKRFFGVNFKPTGFFLPEMAYSVAVARIVKRLGYRWIILDEISYGGAAGLAARAEDGKIYEDTASGLQVVFRNRNLSSAYPPDRLLAISKKIAAANPAAGRTAGGRAAAGVYLTATDAELYGLRHEDPTRELERLAQRKNLRTATISDWLRRNNRHKNIRIALRPSSWESTEWEVKRHQPYRLWDDPGNKIHVNLWKLANLSLALGDKFKHDKNFYWYRWHLVRGLASCTFWWASGRDFSKIYGPYAWSPDEVQRGLIDLVRSVRSLADARTKASKLAAEKYYLKIEKLIWTRHWKAHWQKNV